MNREDQRKLDGVLSRREQALLEFWATRVGAVLGTFFRWAVLLAFAVWFLRWMGVPIWRRLAAHA